MNQEGSPFMDSFWTNESSHLQLADDAGFVLKSICSECCYLILYSSFHKLSNTCILNLVTRSRIVDAD